MEEKKSMCEVCGKNKKTSRVEGVYVKQVEVYDKGKTRIFSNSDTYLYMCDECKHEVCEGDHFYNIYYVVSPGGGAMIATEETLEKVIKEMDYDGENSMGIVI